MNKEKSVEETYVQKSQLEHIIDLPDTYIGSVEKTEIETWVYNDEEDKENVESQDFINQFDTIRSRHNLRSRF